MLKAKTKIVVRLEQSVYDKLVRDLNAHTLVTNTTTELQAGFQLGVQHALNAIRSGLVIETDNS